MLAIAAQGHAGGVDCLDGAHGVALNAGDLHLPTHGVARHAQVVFHADFSGVFHLFGRAAHHRRQRTCGHGARHPHLALAAHLGTRKRCVDLVDDADGARSEQKGGNARIVRTGQEPHVVMQHCGDDPGGTVGGCCDHAAASGVFFVHGHGVEVHPVEHGQRVAQRGLGVAAQVAVQFGRAAAHMHGAGQSASGRAAALHGPGHGLPDAQELALHFGGAVPVLLVGGSDLGHAQARGAALRQQFGPGAVRVGQPLAMALAAGSSGRARVGHALALLVHYKAAANRVVLAHGDFLALRIKGTKTQPVGVAWQAFAPQQHVFLVDPGDAVFAQQRQALAAANLGHGGRDLVGVDGVRLMAGQAQQHSGVSAMPDARGGQRSKQLGHHMVHCRQPHGGLQVA